MDDKPRVRNDIPKIDHAERAASGLRAVESGAASEKPKDVEDNLASNRANEASPSNFYTGVGRTITAKGKKSFWKGKGPIGLIVGLVFGFGFLFAGAQLLQPFSFVAQIRELFNSMQTSVSKRADSFLKMQLGVGKTANANKGTLYDNDTFVLSSTQQRRLLKQGIEVDDVDGNRVLKYKDSGGNTKIVAANSSIARSIGDDAIDFDTAFKSDPDFYHGYSAGTMTWRGAISNWFGNTTKSFLSSNKITRNIFKDFLEKLDESDDKSTRNVALDIMAKDTDKVREGGVDVRTTDDHYDYYESYDDDGNPIRDKNGKIIKTLQYDGEEVKTSQSKRYGSSSFDRTSISSESDVRTKLHQIADNYSGGSLSSAATKVMNYTCLGINFMGGVSLLVSASEALKVMSLITSFLETIDKTKAGLADETPITDLASTLNESKLNEHEVYNDTGAVDKERTAMEAEGMAALYERRKADASDRSMQTFNITGSFSGILRGVGASMAMFESCAIGKIAVSAIGSVSSAIEVGACLLGLVGSIFTAGVSAVAGCGALLGDFIISTAITVVAENVIGSVISVLTPVITNILTRDLIKDIGGEDLGNALVSGANMYLGNTHRANGGSLANEQEYTRFALAQQEVIADNAKYERMTKSPFDMTSKYTFMGTLMTQVMSFLSANSLMSTITSASKMVSNSIVAMIPTATAYNISSILPDSEEYAEICPYLASIGAVGDQFCNPYSITDVSTLTMDPAEVTNRVDSNSVLLNVEKGTYSENFLNETRTDNGVELPIVNKNSDLAKYILYCDGRTSAFGIADRNIASGVSTIGEYNSGSELKKKFVNAALGSIPVVGDMIDVLQNSQMLLNAGYISGQSCVAGNSTTSPVTPDWEDAKYYQRFIEDQSLAESMGIVEKSAVSVFLEEYYEENPLDNSYEGILARYSGMSKEDVIAMLDILDYGNYIASYDPTTRYQFGELEVPSSDEIFFEVQNIAPENVYAVIPNEISYADVRNRSFVV